MRDIRVVVGLDFGTTYSGFSILHVEESIENMTTNTEWLGGSGRLKTNTVLQYGSDFKLVESWGYPALSKKFNRGRRDNKTKPVELFKLYLGNCLEEHKPKLPEQLTYKQAITDYLREIGKLIKERISQHWAEIDFTKNVLLVLTVPAEYSENDKAIMRECAFNAGLISIKNSEELQFTTEPEAAAIYCMHSNLREHRLTEPGTTFMIVDCGGGTVDLTTRRLLEENQLGEVTERAGDFCGSTFIDKEFIKLLKREVGNSAIDLFSDNHYGQLQYLVQEFCQNVKIPFTGNDTNFNHEMDLEDLAPALVQYVTGSEKDSMEEKEWMIELNFDTIKSMFDPIVDRIIKMIQTQLDNSGICSAIFLVGGFGQSKYLQKKIEEKFNHLVKNILIPNQPVAAIVRGAAIYGKSLGDMMDIDKSKCVIATRVLNYTFGVKASHPWSTKYPIDRCVNGGRIHKFRRIIERKTEVTIGQEFKIEDIYPVYPSQTKLNFEIYYTKKQNAVYCDEPDVESLGELHISLPDVHLGKNRPCTLSLMFGDGEIKAKAFNQTSGKNYETKFEFSTF